MSNKFAEMTLSSFCDYVSANPGGARKAFELRKKGGGCDEKVVEPKVVYKDRVVEKDREKIVYKDRVKEVEVEKVVYKEGKTTFIKRIPRWLIAMGVGGLLVGGVGVSLAASEPLILTNEIKVPHEVVKTVKVPYEVIKEVVREVQVPVEVVREVFITDDAQLERLRVKNRELNNVIFEQNGIIKQLNSSLRNRGGVTIDVGGLLRGIL